MMAENWLRVLVAKTSRETTASVYGMSARLCCITSFTPVLTWAPRLLTMFHVPSMTVQSPPIGPSGRLKSSDHCAAATPARPITEAAATRRVVFIM